MRKIVFATNNAHKLREAREIAGDRIQILSLADIGCHDDIPETGDTIEANAMQKALYIQEHYGYDCFADDTGLFVDALGGEPGVYSARYAGPECDADANTSLLLARLDGKADRSARFQTVIAFVCGQERRLYRGVVEGCIATERSGNGGFGYDPVFVPMESGVSFACMSPEQKNAISHRGRAMRSFMADLLR